MALETKRFSDHPLVAHHDRLSYLSRRIWNMRELHSESTEIAAAAEHFRRLMRRGVLNFNRDQLDTMAVDVLRTLDVIATARQDGRLADAPFFEGESRGAEPNLVAELDRYRGLLRQTLVESGKVAAAAGSLASITPGQSPGPVRFAIIGEKLVVAPQTSKSVEETLEETAAARSTILDTGEELIEELRDSNLDRRVLRRIERLQATLQSGTDIIRLGIFNQGLSESITGLEEEAPGALTLLMRTYCRGITLYVGQFDDWARFVETAALAELDETDAEALRRASGKVLDLLGEQPELVDPEVPRILKLLSELIATPEKSGKRALFAMLRTLDNLCSKAFEHVGLFANDLVTNTRSNLANWGGKMLAGFLLGIAISAATGLTPTAMRIPSLQWVEEAVRAASQLPGAGAG